MEDIPMYHDGSRRLQDRFASRKLADRLVEVLARTAFSDDNRAFIESRSLFFLATADAEGRPDCSYKGGLPGFVRVVDPQTLAFPSYDGNGMFKSLGNILVNPHVGMLFIDFEKPNRLRVNGRATVHEDDPLLAEFVERSCSCVCAPRQSFQTVRATFTRCRSSSSRRTRRVKVTRPRYRNGSAFQNFVACCHRVIRLRILRANREGRLSRTRPVKQGILRV